MFGFSVALTGMLDGVRMSRQAWASGGYVTARVIAGYGGGKQTRLMLCRDGEIGTWSPAQVDILAVDWVVVL